MQRRSVPRHDPGAPGGPDIGRGLRVGRDALHRSSRYRPDRDRPARRAPSPTCARPRSRRPDLLLVDSIDALAGAVVQIETTGTFRDPFEGREDVTGRGSGFIVDPAGIVVTNNHVVTGAEKVTVWVGAERAEHEAQVLGASECSDLAVVRIDGGPFPYLDWYQGDIRPGLDIYAAGYPLGDPEYTLYRGIVSRAQRGDRRGLGVRDQQHRARREHQPGIVGRPGRDGRREGRRGRLRSGMARRARHSRSAGRRRCRSCPP